MNITLLSIISPILMDHSPAFVGNHLNIIKTKFSYFFPLLFYNQQTLLLKASKFSKGLGGIIHYNGGNNQELIYNQSFNDINFQNDFISIVSKAKNQSVTIADCSFIEITKPQNEGSPILIKGNDNNISVYMTDNIFQACYSLQGVIALKKCRCVTITHICSYESTCESQYAFLFNNCVPGDFSIFVYNTIVNSKQNNNNDAYNINCNSGNQYIKCNNMTGMQFYGYHFDFPHCFTFTMNTVMNCQQSCIQLSGKIETNKIIENVNFLNNGGNAIIILASQTQIKVIISNSVLLSNGNSIVNRYDNNKATLHLINCFISYNIDGDVLTDGCTKTGYDTNLMKNYPHFTDSKLCRGLENQNKNSAFGCNAGNCFDNDTCNSTIGFPKGVPHYSTFIHLDLQTATFSPSYSFSSSIQFTESNEFSISNIFTKSNQFTKSNPFIKSSEFTKSHVFTRSQSFSKSSTFTCSNPFSASRDFKMTSMFTKSKQFSQSNEFTYSKQFSQSNEFTYSKQFTNSNEFSKSCKFSKSKVFTKSIEFSCSVEFTSSSNNIIPVGKNSGKGNGKTIGIIAGSVGGVTAVGAAIAAFFIIKGHHGVKVEDIQTVDGNKETVVTVNNDLGMMNQDDPFADEFN